MQPVRKHEGGVYRDRLGHKEVFLTAHFQEFNVGGHLHVHVKWTVTALLDVASGSAITPCNKIKRGLQNDLVTLLNGVH